ncbi:MAG: hypothetical protein NT146_01785 [Mycobacterium sp.]|nr:hypothetical protein [Mycobacterium sp.]
MTSLRLRVVVALSGLAIPVATAAAAHADDTTPPVDDLNSFPLASGNYQSSPPDYGWVFFTTPDGRSCGIEPNGGGVGCDAVPSDAPPGTNQTFADAADPAQYRFADTLTFTRGASVLPAGERVQTMGGVCAVDLQGAVHCATQGNHGFILSTDTGVLW